MKRTAADISYTEDEQDLALFAKALSHPVRVQILKLLSNQPCCFTGELTSIIPMAQSTISQHLKALLEAGLIQGEINPPRVKYCLNPQNWQRAATLFEALFAHERDEDRCC
ncbi:winged helix-turn-helix transcriptional regulator [Prosthecochloris sp. N3]|uniref:Winged helix-turn-helix transcriptional regulator n=1 Tax=Prosthecochloris ethylica TaxID=2743976 RepID=A0ABR9XT81_9CHLB|nr:MULTISPECIES: winged helix-turn-helix domain-containing protein [Prosthecochloris]MEC9486828.1 winged helix-turn-helix domain-containing protein [Prosthecochloris sp.]MBF0585965.1 winged helix-turn-helix transcriptional regulator [Prosthecochloris ethylica]MBF0637030.1 winged helix-turn-helix transcriptional regulator [Prosthecochloris ethylica]NUK47267.1 winged helix-turn-helix transcriptional regulator [Prosthecochloris ethylica]RNA65752.1 ArsR family transcriptional regulator [Prosthecoc